MFHIVFDTKSSLVSNFHRQFCAHITHQVGECGVGGKVINEYDTPENISWFNDNIAKKMNDYNFRSPCSHYPTPLLFNDGSGNHYEEKDFPKDKIKCPAYMSIVIYAYIQPSTEVLNEMIERAKDFLDEKNITLDAVRIVEEKTIVTSNLLKEIKF